MPKGFQPHNKHGQGRPKLPYKMVKLQEQVPYELHDRIKLTLKQYVKKWKRQQK